MVTLIEKLKYLYPLAEVFKFGVSDSGSGQEVTTWQLAFPQPTQAELDDVTQSDIDFYRLQIERAGMILSPWQFRKAINAANKRGIVDAALSSMTQDEQDGWHVASRFERLNPLVIKLGGELLGYNDNQLDNFFRNAAEL